MLMQAWRMTARDWRAGELRFLMLSLVVAVAALSSVGFFVDRMRAGLQRDANQLLGGDLVINADQPIAATWRDEAARRGLSMADTVAFPSMALAGTETQSSSQLVSVKAVSAGYPLRGKVTVVANPTEPATAAAADIPAAGTVWVDPTLLTGLKVKVGDSLQLGEKHFTISHVIAVEPDRGAAFMNFAPRVLLPLADLPATRLVQDGSRVTYRLLLAGSASEVKAYQAWLDSTMEAENLKGVRLESLDSGRPEMQSTLERAEQFLSLVGLLSAMLAAVAVAMAARRFMLRHIDTCAMLRCLGMPQRQVTLLFLMEFMVIGLIGSALGVLLGFAAHFVLLQWLGTLFSGALPSASCLPAAQGLLTGLLLLMGFAMPPILQMRDVPHNQVIRREQDAPKPLTLATYLLGLAAFTILLLWQAGNLTLGLLTAGGFFAGMALFAIVAWLSVQGLRPLRSLLPTAAWRFAVTALQRRTGATVIQVVALALGLMALLLLTVVRGDLVTAWHQATPADAPNQFVINIQPEQKSDIAARLRTIGVKDDVLYPMIRGRLVEVNGTLLKDDSYTDERAQRLVNREFNLSTMATLPPQNYIVAGRWYDNSQAEASVEEGLAKTLNLKLGDTLRFDIGGQMAEAKITSLRKLEWGSMRVNFFVILNPALMQDMPQTWITAFHLPAAQDNFITQLTREFPNLTVVDVGSIIRQVQAVIDQVVVAVEFLFLFTLMAGVLVLYAALLGSQDERTREAGLLRALGATRKQLSRAQWIEFALVGGLAGMLAASGAAAIGWLLARFVFKFEWVFDPTVWLFGLALGIACAFVGGWIGLRDVLRKPPLQILREV